MIFLILFANANKIYFYWYKLYELSFIKIKEKGLTKFKVKPINIL